jgi:hypothetical protein
MNNYFFFFFSKPNQNGLCGDLLRLLMGVPRAARKNPLVRVLM